MNAPRRFIVLILLAGLALAACGIKGDPVRPGAEDEPEKKSWLPY